MIDSIFVGTIIFGTFQAYLVFLNYFQQALNNLSLLIEQSLLIQNNRLKFPREVDLSRLNDFLLFLDFLGQNTRLFAHLKHLTL